MSRRRIFDALFAVAGACLLCMPSAHAYIDPGTGSMLLQALAAGLVGILAFGKHIKLFIVGLFTRKRDETADTPGEAIAEEKPGES
jgi:drug/metabolite transporter (DMT)-like permease